MLILAHHLISDGWAQVLLHNRISLARFYDGQNNAPGDTFSAFRRKCGSRQSVRPYSRGGRDAPDPLPIALKLSLPRRPGEHNAESCVNPRADGAKNNGRPTGSSPAGRPFTTAFCFSGTLHCRRQRDTGKAKQQLRAVFADIQFVYDFVFVAQGIDLFFVFR